VTPSGDAVVAAALVSPATDDVEPGSDRRPLSYYRAPDGTTTRDLSPAEMARVVESGQGTLWVDIDSCEMTQHGLLDKVFRLHPLAVEDTLNPKTRVKVEEYPGFLFVIVRAVRFCEETEDPYDIDTTNIYFFLGRNFIISAHSERTEAIREVVDRAGRSPDPLALGPARLMHAAIDAAIDAYFPILEQLETFIDGLEERVFVSFDQGALHDVFSVKRLSLALRRHLAPQREVLNLLTNRPSELLPPATQVYFRDVYDHLLRINESLDNYRDLIGSVLDAYLTQVSNRLSTATKALSVAATVSLPFVVVSGMYGMNFHDIPLAEHPYGFWIAIGLQIGLALAILGALKWRKLI
jgi:magnesium transporter